MGCQSLVAPAGSRCLGAHRPCCKCGPAFATRDRAFRCALRTVAVAVRAHADTKHRRPFCRGARTSSMLERKHQAVAQPTPLLKGRPTPVWHLNAAELTTHTASPTSTGSTRCGLPRRTSPSYRARGGHRYAHSDSIRRPCRPYTSPIHRRPARTRHRYATGPGSRSPSHTTTKRVSPGAASFRKRQSVSSLYSKRGRRILLKHIRRHHDPELPPASFS